MFELQTIQGDGFWSAAPRHSAENAVRRFASKELELSYIPEQTMKTSLISETKFRESPSAVLPETSSNPRGICSIYTQSSQPCKFHPLPMAPVMLFQDTSVSLKWMDINSWRSTGSTWSLGTQEGQGMYTPQDLS
ncbi:hypothetical protein CH063_10834 [Colletotrichum higginsianum]|uniref:Uncharacterized protein n=1 Tax=Colletotrichum higginsianum (strain IMI 349063) TaxID=759273 RepID=H1VJ04_COLHI|nr:hypothetical protein CH063_10834 [Colletotrichum higginsianum]